MDKSYIIKLDGKIIGKTYLEKADPPVGIVFGKIISSNNLINYEFLKSYCQRNKIELTVDYQEDQLISTRTIEQLKIFSPEGAEIKGLGNQIEGMDNEGFEITILGIDYPFYEKEFPHHVREYEERFNTKTLTQMKKGNSVKSILIFSTICLVLFFCFQYHRKQSENPYCRNGENKAIKDAKSRIYNSNIFGLPPNRTIEELKFRAFYKNYLKSKYGISINEGGCYVTEYQMCYQNKMSTLIEKEFGANIFAQAKEEAKTLFYK